MTDIVKGRQVRVEVAATYGAAKTVTEVTAANPGVASSTGHGLTAGSVGYFASVAGMDQLEGQVASVKTPTTDAFTLEKLDTTNFGDYTDGDFIPVTAWKTLSKSTGYEIGGGSADKTDDTTLLDSMKKEGVGHLAAQTVTISGFAEEYNSDAADIVEAAARAGEAIVFRITLKNGGRRIFRGTPSLPNESLSVSANGTGSFEVAPVGQVLRLPAAA